MGAIDARCPHCGAVEDFRRARAVYEASTASIDGRTSSIGVGAAHILGGGNGLGVGVSQGSIRGTIDTAVAQRLAPPPEPQPRSNISAEGCVIVLMLPVFGLFGLLGLMAMLAGIGEHTVGGLGGRVASATFKEQHEAWALAMAQWEKLWYCVRCGGTAYI